MKGRGKATYYVPEGRDKRGPSRGGGRGATALPGEADVLCAVRHIFA